MTVLFAVLALAGQEIPDVGYENAFPGLTFTRVLAIETPPDGTNRLFIIEQEGKVLWFENSPEAKEKHLALDISDVVRNRGNEEGLFGFAFHPKFRENGIVFLHYTRPRQTKAEKKKQVIPDRRNVLSRFRMNADRTKILRESEEVILEVLQPYENHNGGNIRFGPKDGYLYIALGDGGKRADQLGSGQDYWSLLGKFLRIDVDRTEGIRKYAVPPDNPFVGREATRGEIWSLGWRNPWGFHFDRKTGQMWSGDVGQDKWEEICIVVKGGNYGWNEREAFHEFKEGRRMNAQGPFIDPIVEHDHVAAKSITGGTVYRGKKMPELDGVYFYGDFVTGNMWGLRWDGKKVTAHELLFTHPGKQIAIFGEDRDGEVLWSSFDGKIYRFLLKG